ncbi:MAG TPA: hypothetical protein VKB34_08010 [Povalibacter sp.]|nr:hypothetical protein [Povalibacter sp.]
MKRSLPLAVLLAAGTFGLASHAACADAPAAQMSIDELSSRLHLTPEQQSKIAPLAAQRKTKLEEIHGKMSSATSRQDKHALMQQAKQAQDEFTKGVNPILTQDQQAEWKKMRDEARSHMKEQWHERKQQGESKY